MFKAIFRRLFKNELKELEDKKDLMDASIAEADKAIGEIKTTYSQFFNMQWKQMETHEADLKQLHEAIELQKIYCYLIPKLINSSGIELPDGFDITNYEDASKLRSRFMNGDLRNY